MGWRSCLIFGVVDLLIVIFFLVSLLLELCDEDVVHNNVISSILSL